MRLKPVRFASSSTLICVLLALNSTATQGQAPDTRIASIAQLPENMLQGLQYRMIGPHRGGRVTAVAGVPGEQQCQFINRLNATERSQDCLTLVWSEGIPYWVLCCISFVYRDGQMTESK